MSTPPIVAGTDGSSTASLAVDKAGELAQALGAPVHVVCVPEALKAHESPARISAQQIVSAAADRLRSRGITAETHLPPDQHDPALALIAVADQEHAQMIVMGNKGMTGTRRLLGSVPNRVSHRALCDVLIVPTQSRSGAQLGKGPIVVGIDGSNRAMRAVEEAIRLAKALDAELHVVAASAGAGAPEGALGIAGAKAADQGLTAITHMLDGNPVDVLLDVAENHDPAIIVVGSKGMKAGEREWFGNVPDKISHKGTCSVLIVFTGDETGSDTDAASAGAAGDAGSSAEGRDNLTS
jgi:nucleotide-binding universal stress UspA family protein